MRGELDDAIYDQKMLLFKPVAAELLPSEAPVLAGAAVPELLQGKTISVARRGGFVAGGAGWRGRRGGDEGLVRDHVTITYESVLAALYAVRNGIVEA